LIFINIRALNIKTPLGSRVQGFKGSRVQGFKGSRVQRFKGSKVLRFKGSKVQRFRVEIQNPKSKITCEPLPIRNIFNLYRKDV